MPDPVNLRTFRKRKQRADKEEKAGKNRVKHGLSRRDKETSARITKIADKRLDGQKLAPEK